MHVYSFLLVLHFFLQHLKLKVSFSNTSTVIFVSSYGTALDGHIFEYGAVKGGWYGVQYIKIAAG